MALTPIAARRIRLVATVLGAFALVAAVVAIIHGFLADAGTHRKPSLRIIAVLRPPPPPPPPTPKPPEPEMKKEEVKLPESTPEEAPKPADNEPPAGKDLGVDADGSAGSDGFGLVGRKGGRDLLAGGGRFAFYTMIIQQQLQDELAKNKKLKSGDYRAIVKIWLAPDGKIKRFELAGSTGNSETDKLLKLSLTDMPAFRTPPPEDLPQPVRLRITSRGAG